MNLPHPDHAFQFFEKVRVQPEAKDARLVLRACSTFQRAQDPKAQDYRPAGITDRAEWQAAEAWLLAHGYWPAVFQWPWAKVREAVGAVLPGDVVVIGAATGNGKSTVVANLVDAIRSRADGPRTTIFPLETQAAVFRLKAACLRLGFPPAPVFRQRWGFGPDRVGVAEGLGQAAIAEELAAMMRSPERERIRYVDGDTVTASGLLSGMAEAAEWNHRLIVVDHLHHMDHGPGPMTEGIRRTLRQVKGAAKRFGQAVVFMAQIARADKRDQRRPFYPPALTDLQGSSAIEQVADIVLLAYRPLASDVTASDIDAVIMGHREWRSVFQPFTIGLDVAKHRLDGEKRGERLALDFREGRITDDGPIGLHVPRYQDGEREP